jgi:hypothetical protein
VSDHSLVLKRQELRATGGTAQGKSVSRACPTNDAAGAMPTNKKAALISQAAFFTNNAGSDLLSLRERGCASDETRCCPATPWEKPLTAGAQTHKKPETISHLRLFSL